MKKSPEEQLQEALEEIENDPRVISTYGEDGRLIERTVALSEMIEIRRKGSRESESVRSLTFRRPRGKDWLIMDSHEGEIAKSYALAAALADITFKTLTEMDGDDAMLCVKVAGAMGKGSQTGGI